MASARLVTAAFLAAFLLEIIMARPVNAAAIAIANSAEGCVLRAYRDPTGVWTVGYGHTGPDVHAGMEITQAQADAWRAADMARAAAFVDAHVRVPLTDNQFSALAEFVFNAGVGNFLGSTLLRKLNAKNYDAVPGELMKWNKGRVNGKLVTLPGLVSRRIKEAQLWAESEHITTLKPLPGVATSPAPGSSTTPVVKPSAPTIVERIRAWLSGADRVPLVPAGATL
jgi:lysozyme